MGLSLFVCLSVCVFISVYLSFCLPVRMYVNTSVYLCLYLCLSVFLYVCVCLSICILSICICLYLSIVCLFVCIYVCPSVCLSYLCLAFAISRVASSMHQSVNPFEVQHVTSRMKCFTRIPAKVEAPPYYRKTTPVCAFYSSEIAHQYNLYEHGEHE